MELTIPASWISKYVEQQRVRAALSLGEPGKTELEGLPGGIGVLEQLFFRTFLIRGESI
jgi:hypothetical protein